MPDVSILRLIGSLALVIAAIVAIAWLSRKTGLLRATGAQDIRILGSRSLGARHSLAIVQVESARLVLAVSPQQVSLLHILASASPGPAPSDQASAACASPDASLLRATVHEPFAAVMAQLRPRP